MESDVKSEPNRSQLAGWPPPTNEQQAKSLNYVGLLMIVIPLITLLGNLLVIISVLRFRALQSAINFLILGLAVADLLVAITVMPYAVYVYVTNGDWYLGNLMCDIYMALDVGCSTASILLLAVISFDRYRAVSLPIQYSRQAQNVRRVLAMIAGIWVISLTLASPMVFGVNVRPADASPYECRFYNAEFSILSSMISFVIPCFLVLFVYIRIIIALKKREKAAKLRREKNSHTFGISNQGGRDEAAGRIVTGPVVNVMMAALPSMSRKIRRFERHRRAIELAGEHENDDGWVDDDFEYDDDDDDFDDDEEEAARRRQRRNYRAADGQSAVEASAPQTAAMIRRIIHVTTPIPSASPSVSSMKDENAQKLQCSKQFKPATTTSTSSPVSNKEHEFGNSSTPRSSMDSLDENVHVITNDFISENCTTLSRKSSMDESQPTSSQTSFGETAKPVKRSNRKFHKLSRNYSTRQNRKFSKSERSGNEDALIPSIIRTISRRSPRIFRKEKVGATKKGSIILANPSIKEEQPRKVSLPAKVYNSQTETETISASRDAAPLIGEALSRSTTANSAEMLQSPTREAPLAKNEVIDEKEAIQPTVSFSLTVREMNGDGLNNLKGGSGDSSRRVSAAESPLAIKILTRPSLPTLERMDSTGTVCSSKNRADSMKSVESCQSKKANRNGIAVKLVKKAIKHEHSLKRKVSKAQRKEKRATKTLGVVVGVFLVCWVPFFAINILNAVCLLLHKEFCQVGYDLFFYCTWIGYMNSFMNPIIYTIFNTEFRRAFKSIIFGRHVGRNQQFHNKQVHL